MKLRSLWLVLPLALATACGSGTSSSTANQPSNGASTAVQAANGTVTGFGSVVVDGVEYDDTNATVESDTDPASPTPATLGDLRLGQQVGVSFDNGQLAHISIMASVIGPIDAGSINPNDAGTRSTVANSFTVYGQTVVFTPSGDDATVFEGITDATKLQDGQLVEVHGSLDAKGEVTATRVVVLPPGGATVVRVVGVATNTTASTFSIGSLVVNYASAALVPAGATIKDGEKVFVFSDQAPTGTPPNLTITAKAVRVENARLANKMVRIGGVVSSVSQVNGQALPNFTVDGLSVDSSHASLAGGSAASDLAAGAFVRVEGTVSAAGTIQATSMTILPASAKRAVLLIGQITNFVSQKSFMVRGTTVDASKAQFVNGTAAALANGAFVLVRGHVASTGVVADQVVIETPPANTPVRLVGVVSGYSATAAAPQPFTLLGIAMQLDANVTYTNGTSSDFKNGALVAVAGTYTGTAVDVTAVRFLGPSAAATELVTGTVANLTSANGAPTSLVVGNTTVNVTPTTTVVGGPLANGQTVTVTIQLDAASGTATAIRIEVLAPTTVHLMGAITGFKSVSSFTVDEQAVDASQATFVPSTASGSDLAVGTIVRIDGTLANGVVNATTVTIMM